MRQLLIYAIFLPITLAATAAPLQRSSAMVAGYTPQVIADCERADAFSKVYYNTAGDYEQFSLQTTPDAKVIGKSLRCIVKSLTATSAAVKLPWHPAGAIDAIAVWVKNPNGRKLQMALEIGNTAGEMITVGEQLLGDELNWYQIAYEIEPASIDWLQVDSLILRFNEMQPGTSYELYLDQIEAYRAPPLPLQAHVTGLPQSISVGGILAPKIAVIPAKDRQKWPPVSAVVEKEGFTVALTPLEFTGPAPQAGTVANAGDVTLQLPDYLIAGQYQLKLRGQGVVFKNSDWPVFKVTTSAAPPKITVDVAEGEGRILCNGQPVSPVLFQAGTSGDIQWAKSRQLYVLSATSDFDLYGRCADVWIAPDRFDYTQLDARLSRLLASNPDALVLLRVYISSPLWWDAANPAELVKFSDGRTKAPQTVPGQKHTYASWASAKWRKDARDALRKLVEHIEHSPVSASVAGYELCSGEWGNWQYWGASRELFCDYSRPQHQAYRDWLKDHYGNLAALRVAW